MNIELARILARQLVEVLSDSNPPPPPPPPPPVEPPQTGNLIDRNEWRGALPALLSGFFTQRVRISVLPIGGGGKMIPVELISNGNNEGLGPVFFSQPGSYNLHFRGGAPGAVYSIATRPA